MRTFRKTMTVLVVVLVGLGVAVLAIRLYMGRDAESRLRAEEQIDFAAPLPPLDPSHTYVLCPPAGPCKPPADKAGGSSPVFPVAWERLRDYWREMVAMQPRTDLVDASPDRRHLVYIQRSAVFRFPDIITVEFMPDPGGAGSTIAIVSTSRYGKTDLGVNRARVTNWIEILKTMLRREPEA
ncbi:MAG TPA: DUF1499 domain-containing protein [Stellaceae bacterium]